MKIHNRLTSLLLIASFAFSACAPVTQVTDKDVLARQAELRELTAPRTVQVLEEPYMRAVSTPMVTDKALERRISLSMTGTLTDVCAAAAPLTGLVWQIEDALPDTVRRVRFEGSIEGFCGYLSSLYGYDWDFETSRRQVLFARTGTRTFTLIAAPGTFGYKNQITNQSKESDSSSGGGAFGQTVSSSDISSQTAQSNQAELRLNIWSEALDAIKLLLSKTGTVSANAAAGTVTVTDSAPGLRRVGQFVTEYNRKLSRQVALDVRVWQLSISNATDIGLDMKALFQDGQIGIGTGMSLDWEKGGGELNVSITDGRLKGSQATLKALSSFGSTTLLTSGSGITMNNQPFPVDNTTKDTYIAGMSLNTSDYGQTSQITPGEVTTGFSMTVIPHILNKRTLILQYNASLTSLDAIREYTNETVKIEMPKISTRAFSQRVTMRMGQTLVLAGFEQESQGDSKSLGLFAAGKKGQYERNLIIITISVESMPGYEQLSHFMLLPTINEHFKCAMLYEAHNG